jgi:hypothetical protein
VRAHTQSAQISNTYIHAHNLHKEHQGTTKYEPANIEIAFRAVEILLQRCGIACDEILQTPFLWSVFVCARAYMWFSACAPAASGPVEALHATSASQHNRKGTCWGEGTIVQAFPLKQKIGMHACVRARVRRE